MAKDKIMLSCFYVYELYWRTFENKLKKAYENSHKQFS